MFPNTMLSLILFSYTDCDFDDYIFPQYSSMYFTFRCDVLYLPFQWFYSDLCTDWVDLLRKLRYTPGYLEFFRNNNFFGYTPFFPTYQEKCLFFWKYRATFVSPVKFLKQKWTVLDIHKTVSISRIAELVLANNAWLAAAPRVSSSSFSFIYRTTNPKHYSCLLYTSRCV